MYVSIVDYGTGNLNSVSKALEAAAIKINKKIYSGLNFMKKRLYCKILRKMKEHGLFTPRRRCLIYKLLIINDLYQRYSVI